MDLILYLITITCFVECAKCRSIPKDVLSEIEMNESKSRNPDHESRGKFSWKIRKTILRREVQRSENVNGVDAKKFNPEYLRKIRQINSKNEGVISDHLNAHVKEGEILQTLMQKANNSVSGDILKMKERQDPRSSIRSVTENDAFDFNILQQSKGSPYNIIQEMLVQNGGSVGILAMDGNSKREHSESEESSLLKVEKPVISAENQTTANGLSDVFVTKQIFIPTELPTLEINLTNINKFIDLPSYEFTITNLTFNHSKENERPIISENLEYTSDMHEKSSTVLNHTNSFQNNQGEIFNASTVYRQFDANNSKLNLEESEINALYGEETAARFKESSSDKNYTLLSIGTRQNLIRTVIPGIDIDQKNQSKFTYLATENYFSASTFTFNSSVENELQEIATTKMLSNNSEIIENSTSIYEDENTTMSFISSFEDSNADKYPVIGPTLPKCPDPGVCIFWWLAQDLCATDSHCHGALICCMWGCSKMCVDGKNILS